MHAFISAERPGMTPAQSDTAHDTLGAVLHMLFADVTPVAGAYNGVAERSFRVRIDGATDTARVTALAIQADQEALMFVDDNGRASILKLHSLDNFLLGDFREVSPDTAAGAAGYSVINGRYYIAG